MDRIQMLRRWIESRYDVWLDLVRIYLGVGLIVKGIVFIQQTSFIMERLGAAQITFGSGLIAHYVIVAHIGGGALMAFGLLTRVGAAIQIPALLGAVLFVHRQEGLFTAAQTLEFTLLVLFLLVVFSISGSGRLSLDAYLGRRSDVPGSLSPASR